MRLRSFIVLGGSLVLFACGGSQKEAKTAADDSNVWADYKGTYATTATPKGDSKPEAKKAAKSEDKAKAEKPAEDKTEKAVASGGDTTAKKASSGTVNGESISSIGVDTLADASKKQFKAKNATTKFTLGSKYEQLQVALKGGVIVEIIRPAAYPDADGAAVTAPKDRSGALAKGEVAWYDSDADVVMVVKAGKKAGSQKLLGQLLTH